ncbi:FecCD family ABC transporter permease [Amycolatopsis azurea]|uniref:ABC-type Fe3+-siderophore transport system, permease component n=1 Tax=Amycolatopsis azurea DSM 43854 TaxID=1238180 RepID=M2NT35_9PSEU|nr:iron ABC transporter permease [Amycolatopsis azurea]EMD25534.1 ABC-type Fe3+-siderophore transport system, permease component [Amycolatopsis azurea DSM 43854]OOC03990.1 iron ABC transporter permease [Amycolatopsis azurea DSM 43854]
MRTLVLVGSLIALVAVVLLSIGFGSNRLSLGEVLHALFAYDGGYNDVVVRDDRLPRTVLGVLVGMALGLAGALMQAITRNPVAEPGLLGINHGAAVAIVLGSAVFSVTSPGQYVWFAFGGALVGTALVSVIGGTRGATSPLRLVLAGVAIQAVFIGINQAMQMINTHNLQAMRFWLVGSLVNRDLGQLSVLLPFFVAGVVIAVVLARALNALALGEDTARGLGANPALVRVAGMVAVGLLSAAATAACGPIAFVGLMIPHVVRSLVGQDERWVMLLSALLGPVLLLGCDVLGRVAASPAEIQVGVMTEVVGGIAFVIVARRLKAVRR